MNIIGALDWPTEGTYLLEGTDMTRAEDRELSRIRNQKIGFVFQTYNLISKTNALKNVEIPMLYLDDSVGIAVRNKKRDLNEKIESSRIGIPNIQKMMEKMVGRAAVEQNMQDFAITLILSMVL